MLVSIISIKSIAKMLLLLMMGPNDKAPSNVLYSAKPIMTTESLLERQPTLSVTPQEYFKLKFSGIDEVVYFSKNQMNEIISFMNNDERTTALYNGPDLAFIARYIVVNNLFHMGRSELPSYIDAPNNTGPTSGFWLGIGVRPAQPDVRARLMHTHEFSTSFAEIKALKEQGNIRELRIIRSELFNMQKVWCKDSDQTRTIERALMDVNTGLVDLGYLPTQQLKQDQRLLKEGKIKELKKRLKDVECLIADTSFGAGIRRKSHGGRLNLLMEKHYIDNMFSNPFINVLNMIEDGGTPEAMGGVLKLNRTWALSPQSEQDLFQQRYGCHPLTIADLIVAKRPDALQMRVQQWQDQSKQQATILNSDLICLPVTQQIDHLLLKAPSQQVLASELTTMADRVFARYDNLDLGGLSLQTYVQDSIHTIRTTNNIHECMFHIILVSNTLTDLDDVAYERPSLLVRSPTILAKGLYAFVTRCNPFAQSLATFEFWIDLVSFGHDVTVGRLYQSPDVYNTRIENFKKTFDGLSIETLAKLEAEQWAPILGTLVADGICAHFDVSSALNYLKEVERLGTQVQKAVRIADQFKTAFDRALAKNPIVIAKNGMIHRMNNITEEVKGAAKEIIKDSKVLLESAYAKMVAELETEITALRSVFDGTRKGFDKFAHKNIKINYKHILGMDVQFYPNKIDFKGFHHDFMGAIEKSGVVQFVNKFVDKTGVYSADIIVNGVKYEKTFFPATWSRKQVLEAVYEVYDNFKNEAVKQSGGKWLIEGVTAQGINIRMFVTDNGVIKSAYPFLK